VILTALRRKVWKIYMRYRGEVDRLSGRGRQRIVPDRIEISIITGKCENKREIKVLAVIGKRVR
jgi:hypothetical protein